MVCYLDGLYKQMLPWKYYDVSCSIQQSSCYTCYTEDNNGLADKTSTEPGLDCCGKNLLAWFHVMNKNSTWVELSSWNLRQRGYHHRIPDAAPSRALSGVHTPIVVIRESGLTIIILELEPGFPCARLGQNNKLQQN